MNSRFAVMAYNQWVSSLAADDPRRVPWIELAPSDQKLWDVIANTVINAVAQETIRFEARKKHKAANVPTFGVPDGDVTQPPQPQQHAGDAIGHGGQSGFGRLDERIDELEKRVIVLESGSHTHYPRTTSPLEYQGASIAGDSK